MKPDNEGNMSTCIHIRIRLSFPHLSFEPLQCFRAKNKERNKLKTMASMTSKSSTEQKSEEELIKMRQAEDSKSVYNNLNTTDRKMVKAFFSYIDTLGFRKAKKKKSDATAYVQSILWPLRNEENEVLETKHDDNAFDLSEYLDKGLTNSEIPSFLNHTIESMKELLRQGENFDCGQEQAFLKTYSVRENER